MYENDLLKGLKILKSIKLLSGCVKMVKNMKKEKIEWIRVNKS